MKKELEFYVLNYNHNSRKVEMFNIFQNIRVSEGVEKAVKGYLKDKENYTYETNGFSNPTTLKGYEAIKTNIDDTIKWQEWSRVEYEISVGDAFEEDLDKYEKWDCYTQAHANIDLITKMCIDYFEK